VALLNRLYTSAIQTLNLITIGCLQGGENSNITGLKLVRGVGRKTTQDNLVLKAKFQDLQRFVSPEAVAD